MTASNSDGLELQSETLFHDLGEKLIEDQELGKTLTQIIQYNITINQEIVKIWTIDLKLRKVYEGLPNDNVEPDTVISAEDADIASMVNGTMSAQVAIMQQKLKITGSFAVIPILLNIFKTEIAKKMRGQQAKNIANVEEKN